MIISPAFRTFLKASLLIALIVAGIYAYKYHPASAPKPLNTATTTTQTLSDGTTISGLPEGTIITEVPVTPQIKVPDFRAPVVYSPSVSTEVRAAIEPRLVADITLLAANPQNFNAWMDVAILHKIGGDYRGAETIWLYATKNWPTSAVAFHNLADLYQNFLNDPAKAKVYTDLAAKLK